MASALLPLGVALLGPCWRHSKYVPKQCQLCIHRHLHNGIIGPGVCCKQSSARCAAHFIAHVIYGPSKWVQRKSRVLEAFNRPSLLAHYTCFGCASRLCFFFAKVLINMVTKTRDILIICGKHRRRAAD